MPELPEVEVVRRGLENHLTGRRLEAVTVLHPRPVRAHPAGAEGFTSEITGRRVDAVDGRADCRGDEPGRLETLASVVGDQAGLMNGLGQAVAGGAQAEGDAHRGDPHRGAVGGALPAGSTGICAGAHPLQSALGRGAQQVE